MSMAIPRSNYANLVLNYRSYERKTDYAELMTRRMYKPNENGDIEVELTPEEKARKAAERRKLALLIAGHNEEMVIEQTLRSAINAGMAPEDIYVVDDNSDDATKKIAISVIGKANVMKVRRSGKGLALTKGAKKFQLTKRYEWIHIADADGGFASHYFDIFRHRLNPHFAAATGYVRSLPGGSVSQYRVFEYTIGMEIHRRFQAMTHTVSVIPGPTSCFRADVFDAVNFANKSIAEDFDVTLQLHRQKLGQVQFIPQAIAYTQDPLTLADFKKQITRWNRGIMQGVHRHRIGLKASRIDAYLTYQVMQNFLFLFNYGFILPYMALTRHSGTVLAMAFLMDVGVLFAITSAVAAKAKRKDILSAFPQIYLYRWVTLFVFLKAFWDVMIRGKYRVSEGVWGTAGRRYKNPVAA
jgi:cellulose synthase/poly-beta-1,6-N-acetylglucosamine synthase-like glycosyltransferase